MVRDWARQPPRRVEIRDVSSVPGESMFSELDPGEREAIQLARETAMTLLLIDGRHGARIA